MNKQVTIIFDDKHLGSVSIHSRLAISIFERILQHPVQMSARRIVSNAFDRLLMAIEEAIHNDVDKNSLFLFLSDLQCLKEALDVVIRGHKIIAIKEKSNEKETDSFD